MQEAHQPPSQPPTATVQARVWIVPGELRSLQLDLIRVHAALRVKVSVRVCCIRPV